jgi:NAD(P)-dependent dehydrogenase (short-subunit alcohol dehydrogenase family)
MATQAVNPSQPIQAAFSVLKGGNTFQQKDVANLHGRVAIVTGGTAGIGYEVAKPFALAGARVIILSRKPEHGEEAVEKPQEEARNNPNFKGQIDINFVECDFGSLKNVKEVADRLREQESRLDLLINNAGVGVNKYGLDSDGIERCFGVNVLGHFLFINRLLPLIRKTARDTNFPPPRIINLTSNLHKLASSDTSFLSLDELNNPDLRPDLYYDRSKLGIILYSKKLVEYAIKPYSEKIYVLAVHPGAVATEIQEQIKMSFGQTMGTIIQALQAPMMRTPAEGSISTLWAAVAPEIEEKNLQGVYVSDPGVVGGETDQAKDMKLAENVWQLSLRLIDEKLGGDALLKWNETSA